jgi:hypothetical protein
MTMIVTSTTDEAPVAENVDESFDPGKFICGHNRPSAGEWLQAKVRQVRKTWKEFGDENPDLCAFGGVFTLFLALGAGLLIF